MKLFNKDGKLEDILTKMEFAVGRLEKHAKDVPLDKLHHAVNEGRGTQQYPLIGYARLNTMLKALGKSRKNWSRDILIGNILDAQNPAKYFWFLMKENKKK